MGYEFNDGPDFGYVKRCLECGEPVPYGRTDKVYCCDSCRNRFNYGEKKLRIRNRTRVMKILSGNYSVLQTLLREKVESADLSQMVFRGFNPEYMTWCQRRPRYSECCCFDIRYNLTRARIFSISKL